MENNYYGDIHQALYNIIANFDADKAGDSIYNIFNSALDAFDEDDGAVEVTAGTTPDEKPTEKIVEHSWVHHHPDQVEAVAKLEAASCQSVEKNNTTMSSNITVIQHIVTDGSTPIREFYLNKYWMARFVNLQLKHMTQAAKEFVDQYEAVMKSCSDDIVFVIPSEWEYYFYEKDGNYVTACIDMVTKYISALIMRPINIRVQETPEQRYYRNVGRYRHLIEDMKYTIDEDLHEFMLYLVEQDEKRRQKA